MQGKKHNEMQKEVSTKHHVLELNDGSAQSWALADTVLAFKTVKAGICGGDC